MRMLIFGNSFVASLINCFKERPSILGDSVDVDFLCVPGGWGPKFDVIDDYLVLDPNSENKEYRAFTFPADRKIDKLSNYDVVMISAPGLLGGSINSSYDLMFHGLIFNFDPVDNVFCRTALTESAYKIIIENELLNQSGVKLVELFGSYPKLKVLFQPMPLLSSKVIDNEDFILNKIYKKPLEAMRFFNGVKRDVLIDLCRRNNATYLGYPDCVADDGYCTPSLYIDHPDGLHTNNLYAELVFKQIKNLIY